MQLDAFDYSLPEDLIAQHPPAARRDARLLAMAAEESGGAGALRDLGFADLPGLLRAGDLLVLNDTRVIPARLYGRKDSGGAIEVLLERKLDAQRALVHMRASKAPRAGTRCLIDPGGELQVLGREDDLFIVESVGQTLDDLFAAAGHMPLPPYITRADEAADNERYQTVYAREPGAVAAPTAGLHFDTALLGELSRQGIEQAFVTLHVGAGTFRPVRGEDIDAHVMHAEHVVVSEALCAALAATRVRGGRIIAVGTTVVRALESAARAGVPLAPFSGDTQLFIRPGFEFRVVDALVTNFHLPRSTLLMLVCAFGGYSAVMAAYYHAIAARYRFFSYGDAVFIPRAVAGTA